MPILDLSKMTKDELLRLAKTIKIPMKQSMLKGEILTVLKRETRKAAKIAEAKKAKPKTVKATSKRTPASGKKVAAKKAGKTDKLKKSAKPATSPVAAVKKGTAPHKATSIRKSQSTVAKAKSQKTAPAPKKKSKRPATRKKSASLPASPSRYQGGKGYDAQSLQPKFELEDMAQEAKFIIGKPDIRGEFHIENSSELPLDYGDNKIVMLVRDPYWCYLYWELQEDHIEGGYRRLSRSRNEVRHVLRLHPADGEGTPFDVDVDFRHQNHYLQLSPGASFYTEIGLLDCDGNFAALAVSNTVTLPLDSPSEIIDEKWITTDENFEELYILSGGEVTGAGKTEAAFGQAGSAGLQLARREQGRVGFNMSSSGVGSFGSAQIPKPNKEVNFSYWLDTELILYGGADLGSTIQLSGKNLDLRPDGTFTVRFALPEGELKLPVTFTAPDQSKVHTVTPNVTRRTKSKTGGADQ